MNRSCNIRLEHNFILKGHTDSDDCDSYNIALSKKRCEAVYQALTKLGVEVSKLSISSHGEFQPLEINNSETGKAVNRRVELIYNATYLENAAEVLTLLTEAEPIHRFANTQESTLITGTAGVKVFVPEHAMVTSSGDIYEGEYEIILTEALDIESFLANKLATLSGDEYLESGGMFKIEAKGMNGEILQLKEGQNITSLVPNMELKEDMEIFISDSGQNWQTTATVPMNLGFIRYDLPDFIYPNRTKTYTPQFREDYASKPRRPAEPALPKMPSAPAMPVFHENFFTRIFHTHDAQKAQAEKSYKKQLQVYAKRMNKYDRKVKAFEDNCEVYAPGFNKYKAELQVWQLRMDQERKLFNDSVAEASLDSYLKRMNMSRAEYDAQIEAQRAAMSEAEKQYYEASAKLGVPGGRDLNGYIFEMSKLGWANVDRFMKYPPQEKQELMVRDMEPKSPLHQAFVVLNDGQSLIPFGDNWNGQFVLSGFPKNEKGLLIAYKVEEGRLMLHSEPFVGKKEFKPEFYASSITELKDILQGKVSL